MRTIIIRNTNISIYLILIVPTIIEQVFLNHNRYYQEQVSWGCRIRRHFLFRGVRPLPTPMRVFDMTLGDMIVDSSSGASLKGAMSSLTLILGQL